jgi:hypothetical protein
MTFIGTKTGGRAQRSASFFIGLKTGDVLELTIYWWRRLRVWLAGSEERISDPRVFGERQP